jgi:AcrR family transcriptional regulator
MPAPTRTPAASWIEEGLRALALDGPDAVRVEALAKTLGVSKGGFYHQFKDRSALLEALLDAWERMVIDEAIEQVEADDGDARERLRRLRSLATSNSDFIKMDLAIRDWARRDPAVDKRLRRIDHRRLEYLRSLFRSFCADEDEVEIRCLLVMTLFIGEPLLASDHGSRRRAELMKLAHDRLLET